MRNEHPDEVALILWRDAVRRGKWYSKAEYLPRLGHDLEDLIS